MENIKNEPNTCTVTFTEAQSCVLHKTLIAMEEGALKALAVAVKDRDVEIGVCAIGIMTEIRELIDMLEPIFDESFK